MYEYHAELIRVIDGDTYELRVDVGLRADRREHFRIAGVDTPEVFGVKKISEEYALGIEAKEFVEEWFSSHGNRVFIRTYKMKTRAEERRSLARYIADVWSLDGTESLRDAIEAAGHAKT